MYQVYLAGVVTHITYKEATGWREYVSKQCYGLYGEKILCKSPLRFNDHLDTGEKIDFVYEDNPLTTSKAITTRCLNDVRNSDLLLVNLNTDKASIGTDMEILLASELRIPIIGVFSNDPNNIYNQHPFVQELVNFKCNDLDTAITLINQIL